MADIAVIPLNITVNLFVWLVKYQFARTQDQTVPYNMNEVLYSKMSKDQNMAVTSETTW